ncbi:hypothetical protein D3C76_1563130 [compost metagenome]
MLLIRLGPAAGFDERGEPLGQVIGVVRVDAHARRVAVQGVAQFHGAVGLAPAQFAARLDDQYLAPARQAQQLRGQHGTAQTATDDQDIGLPGDALLMSLQRCFHTALQESNHHVS